jgi:hypothetical protein
MPQELKIKISSDVGGAINGIRSVNHELEKTAPAVQKTTKNFTGLTRVLQDAPFGFIAISNNLEQLIPAAGGAGLAFSALISIVSFAQIGFANWTRGIGDNEDAIKDHLKAVKDAREALDNYVDSLDDINQARVKGNQNAQEELVKLKTLYDATQDQNIAISKRKELVDELQSQYPKYFANIKDEIILAGGAKDAYDRLTASILATARAEAAKSTLVDIQKQILAVEQQQTDNQKAQLDAQNKIAAVQKKNASSRPDVTGNAGAQVVGNLVQVQNAQEHLNDKVKEGNNLNKQRNDLLDRAKKLSGDITATVEANPDSLLKPGGKLDKVKKEVEQKNFHFAIPIEPTIRNAPALAKEVGKAFSDAHIKPALEMDEASDDVRKFQLDVLNSFSRIHQAGDQLGKGIGALLEDVFLNKVEAAVAKGLSIEQLEKFQEALKSTIVVGSELADVLGTAFGAFGAALVQGQNALQAFFTSVKNSLSQIIAQLFKTVAVAAILSVITGGAAGGGVSFLSAFKSLLGGGKGFAEGGLVTGPTRALIGEGVGTSRANPEVVAPLDKLKKMIGGGGQSMVFIPDLHVGYDQWRISFNRANDQGRKFG